MFINPTKVTRVTSGFRPSNRKNHHGVDFALAGTHEIYAAASGTVTRSYASTSYGECVMIMHNINGQIWETVYAHMRAGSRRVKVGQKVSQGQVLGIMGNTGQSTGQHLHFELHKGRWNVNKTNAVDPLKYLNNKSTSSVNSKEAAITVIYGNKKVQGKLINNTSYAPVRELGELLGASVGWNGKQATLNGSVVNGMLIGNKAYAPVRNIAEKLGYKISWDGKNKTVYVSK